MMPRLNQVWVHWSCSSTLSVTHSSDRHCVRGLAAVISCLFGLRFCTGLVDFLGPSTCAAARPWQWSRAAMPTSNVNWTEDCTTCAALLQLSPCRPFLDPMNGLSLLWFNRALNGTT